MFAKSLLAGILALAFTVPLVSADGCYSSRQGLPFAELHGIRMDEVDFSGEINGAIDSICSEVENAVFESGRGPHKRCSLWPRMLTPACYTDCINQVGLHDSCDYMCDGGPQPIGTYNRIVWPIDYLDGESEKTLLKANCTEAFKTEYLACSHGSEQVHDGFRYRIDPNSGTCEEDDCNPVEGQDWVDGTSCPVGGVVLPLDSLSTVAVRGATWEA